MHWLNTFPLTISLIPPFTVSLDEMMSAMAIELMASWMMSSSVLWISCWYG